MPQRSIAAPRRPKLILRPGIWRLILLGIIFITIIGYISPVRDYIAKNRQISREQVVRDELRQQRDRLLAEKDLLSSTAYVEKIARRDLGMVRPGEQPYAVRDLNQDQAPPEPVAANGEQKSLVDRFMDTIVSLLP